MSTRAIRLTVAAVLAIIVIVVVLVFYRDWFATRIYSDQNMPSLRCTAEPCPTGQ